MRKAAVRGLIPASSKVTELRSNLTRLMSEMAVVLDERFGDEGLAAISDIFRRLGEQDAKALKDRLGLGEDLKDALDGWLVVGHVMGAKMEPKWKSDREVETYHPFCPQYGAFKTKGKLYCESICLPYVEGVAKGIAPKVDMRVVRPADNQDTCIKSLLLSNSEE